MSIKHVKLWDLVALLGGVVLAVSLFVSWFVTDPGNKRAQFTLLDGSHVKGAISAWELYPFLRFFLLLAAIAPVLLVYLALRNEGLSWQRGELTAVAGVLALGLVFYNGGLVVPGSPTEAISHQIGWYIALLGAAMIMVGGAVTTGGRPRQPPGV